MLKEEEIKRLVDATAQRGMLLPPLHAGVHQSSDTLVSFRSADVSKTLAFKEEEDWRLRQTNSQKWRLLASF